MALMDNSLLEYLKRLALGNQQANQNIGQTTGKIPVPQQRPVEQPVVAANPAAVAADGTPIVKAATPAAPAEEEDHSGLFGMSNPLSYFQKDPAKRDALSQSLLSMGANMMVAGGPRILGGRSDAQPTNFLSVLGQGIDAGQKTFDTSLTGMLKKQEDDKKQQLADDAEKQRVDRATAIRSDKSNLPLNIAELKQQWAAQIEAGDDTSARATQAQIQEIATKAASEGMIYDENGNLKVAEGFEEGVDKQAESKAAATERGKNSEVMSPDQVKYNEYVKWMTENGKKDQILGPDEYRTKVVADEDAAKKSEAVKKYEFYVKQQKDAGKPALSMDDWEKSQKSGFQVKTNPDGTVEVTQGPTSDKAGKFTEQQQKDISFYNRGNEALNSLENHWKDLSGAADNVANHVPIVGNYLTSDKFKLAKQSGNEFLMALLRKDTGASITKEEQSFYGGIYLPVPGDPQVVLERKKAAARRAIDGIKAGMTADQLARVELENQAREDADAGTTDTKPKPSETTGMFPEKVDTKKADEKQKDGPVAVKSLDEAKKLPKGTIFILNGRRGKF